MRNKFLVIVLIVILAGFAMGAESPSYFAFVSNEKSGDVTVIDGTSDAVVGTFAVGKRPRGIHATPDGKRIFVTLSGSPRMAPRVDTERAAADKTADGLGVIDVFAPFNLQRFRIFAGTPGDIEPFVGERTTHAAEGGAIDQVTNRRLHHTPGRGGGEKDRLFGCEQFLELRVNVAVEVLKILAAMPDHGP